MCQAIIISGLSFVIGLGLLYYLPTVYGVGWLIVFVLVWLQSSQQGHIQAQDNRLILKRLGLIVLGYGLAGILYMFGG